MEKCFCCYKLECNHFASLDIVDYSDSQHCPFSQRTQPLNWSPQRWSHDLRTPFPFHRLPHCHHRSLGSSFGYSSFFCSVSDGTRWQMVVPRAVVGVAWSHGWHEPLSLAASWIHCAGWQSSSKFDSRSCQHSASGHYQGRLVVNQSHRRFYRRAFVDSSNFEYFDWH